jgi:hypothetical protein
MKKYFFYLIAFTIPPMLLTAQGNVGIGGAATRARLEVFGVAGAGNTSAVFGSDGAGVSFQQNWPSVGFNQYRDAPTGNGRYMAQGYAAVEHLDPGSGTFALDMQSVAGLKDAAIAGEYHRAFTIFSNGTVCFGKGQNNSNMIVDYLNLNGTNAANGSIYFHGTQYASYINVSQNIPTQIGPGKDNGYTYINDLTGNNVVIGGNATKVGINTAPLYLTTLSIRHAQAGNGLLLREQTSGNNWEWYVSNDNPVWIGQKYNGLLIGDYNPNTGVHGYVSDRRLKTSIKPLRPVLDNLMQVQAVQYRMKNADPASQPTQGFIAQDVKKHFPELVSVINDNSPGHKGLTDLHMLQYSQFFVVAIKAIQEQQIQIAALNKEISKLEQSN